MHGKRFETDSSLHVDQQWFDVEFFFNGVPRQPSLAPVPERAHECEKFLSCFGEVVLRSLFGTGTYYNARYCQRLKALGKHRSGNTGYGAADVVESSISEQQLANNEQRPSSSEDFVSACDGAELAVSWHQSILTIPDYYRRLD
jgi:hypothetical protein